MKTFEVTTCKTQTFKEGFGVALDLVYGEREDGSEYIAEVDGEVVEIKESLVRLSGNIPCIYSENLFKPGMNYPVENFKELEDLHCDDTHDLRYRFFETKEEAEEHLKYTLNRWKHPQVWESFVQL